MPSAVAMSTGWNSKRHVEAKDIIDEIVGLGINGLEAGYTLTMSQLEGLVALLPQHKVQVTSVHNFCPKPASHKRAWGDDFILSSLDEEKRRPGVEATLETLEWARKLGARIVVMHLGQVDLDKSIFAAIKQASNDGRPAQDLEPLVKEAKWLRASLADRHLDAVRRSLEEIVARLPDGIILGLESRSDHHEIPNLAEMQQLLSEFGDAVGYWHDVGHTYMQESQGYYAKDEYVKTLCRRMVGLHIHDAVGTSDHRAPGDGEIDYAASVKPYLREGMALVLELHPRVTPEEAARGIKHLQSKRILP